MICTTTIKIHTYQINTHKYQNKSKIFTLANKKTIYTEMTNKNKTNIYKYK